MIDKTKVVEEEYVLEPSEKTASKNQEFTVKINGDIAKPDGSEFISNNELVAIIKDQTQTIATVRIVGDEKQGTVVLSRNGKQISSNEVKITVVEKGFLGKVGDSVSSIFSNIWTSIIYLVVILLVLGVVFRKRITEVLARFGKAGDESKEIMKLFNYLKFLLAAKEHMIQKISAGAAALATIEDKKNLVRSYINSHQNEFIELTGRHGGRVKISEIHSEIKKTCTRMKELINQIKDKIKK